MLLAWISWQLLLAAADPAAAANPDPGNAQPGGLAGFLPLIPVLIVMYYIIVIRPDSKGRKQQRLALDGLKKNDRVLTIGGIYGVVANVQREADRVTIKIDEATGAKMDVTFSAISRLIVDESKAEKEKPLAS